MIHWATPVVAPIIIPDKNPIPAGTRGMTITRPAIQPIAVANIHRQALGIRWSRTKHCAKPAPTPAVTRAIAGSNSQPSSQPMVVAIIQ
jgi:hypothetical protein